MTEYKCYRCGYHCALRDLRKHCGRKNICKPLLEDIKLDVNSFIKRHNGELVNDKCKFVCDHCLKKFASNRNLSRHSDKSCKIKNSISIQGNTNATNTGNDNNAIIGNNNTTNSPTITINNFGSEDIRYLIEDKVLCTYCAKNGIKSHSCIYSNLYFNNEHPENQTIKLSDLGKSYLKISKDGVFVDTGNDFVIDDVLQKSIHILRSAIQKHLIVHPYMHLDTEELNEKELQNNLIKIDNPTRDEARAAKQDIRALIHNGPTDPTFPEEVLQEKKNEQDKYAEKIKKFFKKILKKYIIDKDDILKDFDEDEKREYIMKNFFQDIQLEETEENIDFLDETLEEI